MSFSVLLINMATNKADTLQMSTHRGLVWCLPGIKKTYVLLNPLCAMLYVLLDSNFLPWLACSMEGISLFDTTYTQLA